MNVLISCSGKQVNLVLWFKKHLQDSSIVVCDSNKHSPSFSVADKNLIAPSIYSPHYKEWILNACKNNNIKLIISLYEPELIILESLRADLEELGSILVGANKDIIEKITDKYFAKQLLETAGIPYPHTELLSEFSPKKVDAQYILKPRVGRGSRGIIRCQDANKVIESRKLLKNPSDYIVQEFIEGEQYCFDVLNDLERNFVTTFVRQRLKMGPEETEVAITQSNAYLSSIGEKISKLISHQGSIDVEAIKHKNAYYIIDVNVRFGGSYPFSHAAGADIPGAIVSWVKGKKPPSEFLRHEDGVVSSKYNSVIRLK